MSTLIEMDQERLSLGHGMMTYWFKGGDAIANHLERSSRLIGTQDLIGVYFHNPLYELLFNNADAKYLPNILAQSHNVLHASRLGAVRERCEGALVKMQAIKSGLRDPLESLVCKSMDTGVNRMLSSRATAFIGAWDIAVSKRILSWRLADYRVGRFSVASCAPVSVSLQSRQRCQSHLVSNIQAADKLAGVIHARQAPLAWRPPAPPSPTAQQYSRRPRGEAGLGSQHPPVPASQRAPESGCLPAMIAS